MCIHGIIYILHVFVNVYQLQIVTEVCFPRSVSISLDSGFQEICRTGSGGDVHDVPR